MKFKFFGVALLVVGLVLGLSSMASAKVTISFDDPNSIANASVDIGTVGIPAGVFTLANDSTATAVVVSALGLDVNKVWTAGNYEIWKDVNKNGILDKGDIKVKTSAAIPATGPFAATLTTAVTIPAASNVKLILVLDSTGATNTQTVKIGFQVCTAAAASNNATTPAGATYFATDLVAGNVPTLAQAALATITAVTAGAGSMTAAAHVVPIAAANWPNTTTGQVMARFKITNNDAAAHVLTQISVTPTAVGMTGANLANPRIYLDVDNSGTVNAGDIELVSSLTTITTGAANNYALTTPVFFAGSAVKSFIITADGNSTAAEAATLSTALTAATTLIDANASIGGSAAGAVQTMNALAITAKATKDYTGFPYKQARPNGYLDAVKLTFSRAVADSIIESAVLHGDIAISTDDTPGAGGAALPYTLNTPFLGAYQGDVANNTVANIRIVEQVIANPLVGKTGDQDVTVAYTASTSRILSADGLYALPNSAAAAVADGAAPVPLSIVTADANPADGKLDKITIQFSENLAGTGVANSADSTVNMVRVAGYASANAATALSIGTVTGNWNNATSVLNLALTPKAYDTGATPAVSFLGGVGVIKDAAANDALAWTGISDIPTADGAAPIIVNATTKDANNNGKFDGLAVKFSEPVKFTTGKTMVDLVKKGAITTGFAFINGFESVYSFADSGHTGVGTGTITMMVNEQLIPDTGVIPGLSFATGVLTDFAATPIAVASVSPVTIVDGISAELLSATSIDGGVVYPWGTTLRNGKIDTYKLVFSEQMSGVDSTWNAWKVGGVSVAHDSTMVVGETVYLKIKEGAYDTATLQQVTYDTTGVGIAKYTQDLGGGILTSINAAAVVETDGAAPYVTATTQDTPRWTSNLATESNGKMDAYLLTFSEAIDTTGVRGNGGVATSTPAGNGLWDHEGFIIAGHSFLATPGGVDTLTTFGADLKSLLIRVNEVAVDTGTIPDLTFYATATSKIKDAAGNITPDITAVTTAGDITEIDGIAPVVSSAKTIDDNQDGYLDGVLMTFSENVSVAANADTTAVRTKVVMANIGATKVDLTNATITSTGNTDVKLVGVSSKDLGQWNTAKKPNVAINSGNGIKDAAGNNARAYNRNKASSSATIQTKADSVATTDNAAPVLVQASGQLNQKTILLRFSEPVTNAGAALTNALTFGNFTYKSAVGPNTIKSVTLTTTASSDTSQWVATVDSTLTMARLQADSLIIAASAVQDQQKPVWVAGANVNPADTLAIYDAVLPTLISAVTVDADSNGFIDDIKLTFSENINDANLLGTPAVYRSLYFGWAAGIDTMWTVSGYKVIGVNLTASADSAASATGYMRGTRNLTMQDKTIPNVNDVRNDNIIYLFVKSTATLDAKTGDTGNKPTVSFKGGAKEVGVGVGDYTPNYAASVSNFATSDGCPPILLAANMPSRTQMNIYVSEPYKAPLPSFSTSFVWIVGTEALDFATLSQVVTFTQDATVKNLYKVTLLSPGINYDSPSYLMYRPLTYPTKIYGPESGTLQDANSVKTVVTYAAANDSIIVTPPSAVGVEVANVPAEFALSKNFPNPFNPTTTINYDIAENGGNVSLVIYNMTGQKIRTLVNEVKAPGFYKATWDGLDDGGATVSSGIYLYKIVCGSFSQIEKMTLVK